MICAIHVLAYQVLVNNYSYEYCEYMKTMSRWRCRCSISVDPSRGPPLCPPRGFALVGWLAHRDVNNSMASCNRAGLDLGCLRVLAQSCFCVCAKEVKGRSNQEPS